LELRLELVQHTDYPALEWVGHLTNNGDADTPILSDILALDAAFALPREQGATVHHARGSLCAIDDFEPLRTDLNATAAYPQGGWRGAGNPVVIESLAGRSSCGTLPFFDLQLGEARGVIGAIGWSGGWTARFHRQDDGAVRVRAGMSRTHLVLHPGESIRTPSIVLMFWEGVRIRAHNLWRRLMLAHYAPQRHGERARAPISFAMWGMNHADRQLGKVAWFAGEQLPIDNFWIDAGWHGDCPYQSNANVFNSPWGAHVGNGWPNPEAYPDGLGAIGRACREAGFDFTLWFEPERVFRDTAFAREHPEWLFGPLGDNQLFNLGHPDARQALTDLISNVIEEGGITVYRQDFNTDPAPFWDAADAPDRVGMSEIRHIEGLYRFWDDLLARHPGLLIDNCSSGGRRIDIETNRRSIPLWRSDFQCFPDFDPIGLQGQTHGLAPWVPLSTGACDRADMYAVRSAHGPGVVWCTAVNPKGEPEGVFTPWESYEVAWLRDALAEQAAVRPLFEGDFYPLTSFTLATDAWCVWQWDRPDLGEGLVLAFRRQDSPFAEFFAYLQALDVDAHYELRDSDTGHTFELPGALLAHDGFQIAIPDRPAARLLWYRKLES
ncbi:MAG: alpha-galactosidase, partial [Armatimonadetes bacterium]|nr:alpha-galactosidase [Armatimonadota bacterium]